MHATVLQTLPAVAALGAAATLSQRAAETARVLLTLVDKSAGGSCSALGAAVVHSSPGYVSLVNLVRPFDVQPMDGLAVCSALLQHRGSNFGRALLLASSDAKFSKVDEVWRRLFEVRTYMAQAFANIVCVTSVGAASPMVAPHFPAPVALKALGGHLHGPRLGCDSA